MRKQWGGIVASPDLIVFVLWCIRTCRPVCIFWLKVWMWSVDSAASGLTHLTQPFTKYGHQIDDTL